MKTSQANVCPRDKEQNKSGPDMGEGNIPQRVGRDGSPNSVSPRANFYPSHGRSLFARQKNPMAKARAKAEPTAAANQASASLSDTHFSPG